MTEYAVNVEVVSVAVEEESKQEAEQKATRLRCDAENAEVVVAEQAKAHKS